MAGALLGATTANADTKIDDTHVRVEAGDTVSGIANKYGTDVSTIASASNLSDANKIFVGDILVLTPEAQQPTTNNVQTPVANQAQPASQATVNYSTCTEPTSAITSTCTTINYPSSKSTSYICCFWFRTIC
jgi:LysM repeat protein